MRNRQINYLRHPLSAKQALSIALDCWGESRAMPVLLITPKGQAMDVAKNIRVILSKERYKTGQKAYYGFTLGEPFPWTEGEVTGEAIVLNWRLTPLQNIRNMNLFKPETERVGNASQAIADKLA